MNRIIAMNHSAKYQAELDAAAAPWTRADEINSLLEAIEVQAGWVKYYTDTNRPGPAEHVRILAVKFQHKLADMHKDPRTPAQVANDLDDAETLATRLTDYPL